MILKFIGGLLIILMVSLLVMLSAQETFKDILEPLGLYHLESGVFTDCSLPENKHIKFCEPEQGQDSGDWRGVKDGPGFKLSGD